MANRPGVSILLRDAEEARWSLEEGTAGLVGLDFGRPFLPEALVHAKSSSFLDASDQLVLNQIRGHAYLGLSILGEKLVLPFVMSQASRCLNSDGEEFLALMGVGQQAAKHIVVFDKFALACQRGFDTELGVIGPAADVLARFLTRDTLALGLLALHVECAAQPHSLRAMRATEAIDAQFQRLLQLHWREECQNARLLELVLEQLSADASRHQHERAIEQYFGMLTELSASFRAQVELDLVAFERTVRPLSESQRNEWRELQGQSYDEVFLHHGTNHPAVRRTIVNVFAGESSALDAATMRFSVSRVEATRQT